MRRVLAAGRRALWRHPVQLVLAVIGIAIGVAVVVAVDLANHSAREAMRQSVDRVAGRATHQVVGGPAGLAESFYRHLRVELGIRRAAPVVEGGLTLPDHGDRPLTLLGLDPFAEGPFRGYLVGEPGRGGGGLTELLVTGRHVALPAATARELGLAPGDDLRVRSGEGGRRLELALTVDGGDRDLSGLAFADIAAAQEWLGRVGRLDRIDLILDDAEVAAVHAALPEGAALIPAARRGNALAHLSEAFQLNLTALSLLALIVGLFLVFNTMSFLVVQRRRLLGTLRALGVTRTGVVMQVLADAALVGAAGTAVGLPLGVLLGTGVTELVLGTIDQLYFDAVGGLRLDGAVLAKGAALGLAGTVLASLPAAREAAAVDPRRSLSRADLEGRARAGARYLAVLGAVAGAAGALVLAFSTGLVAAFVGLFTVIIAVAAMVPLAVVRLGLLLGAPRRAPLWWRLCVRGAVATISRTGIAVAALTVAVASVIGVSVMIDSFRTSVRDWLAGSLQADYYVSATAPMPPAIADRLAAVDGVEFVTRSRYYRLPTADGFVPVWGLALPARAWSRFDIRRGDPDAAWRAFSAGEGVLVSEPFAADRGVGVGDRIRLPGHERRFPVAGVFRDYGSVQGVVLMPLATYRAVFGDRQLTGIGVHLRENSDRDAVAGRLRERLTGLPGAQLTDNRSIYRRSLAVFDQTFVITSVLRLLAAVVAFVGVLGALMALQLDRTREYATYRALGLTRGQLTAMTLGESGVLGAIAGLCAVPLGIVLAALLVFVINQRAFGWSMAFTVEAGPLVEGVALAVVAALIAAVYPAWQLGRRPPAAGLQEE